MPSTFFERNTAIRAFDDDAEGFLYSSARSSANIVECYNDRGQNGFAHRDNTIEVYGHHRVLRSAHHDHCPQCGSMYSNVLHYAIAFTDDDGEDHEFCQGACARNAGWYENSNYDCGWAMEPETEDGLLPYYYENHNIDSTTSDNPFLIGFEVEKEDESYRWDSSPHEAVKDYGWVAVSDGSLDDNGFELVSRAYNLANLAELRQHVSEMDILDADYSKACGGHITISEKDKTGKELHERLTDFNALLYALYPWRLKNSYAVPKKHNENSVNSEKYRAINVKPNRVEYRIFSAVRTGENLMWRVELINWAVQYNRENVLVALEDKTSWLYNHLLKVYSAEQIETKKKLFLNFSHWMQNEEYTPAPKSVRSYLRHHPTGRLRPTEDVNENGQVVQVADDAESSDTMSEADILRNALETLRQTINR